jgi:uncharacterized protein (DUF2141 family)
MFLTILLLFYNLTLTPMHIQIKGVAANYGQLRIAVFNRAEGFLDPKKVFYATSVRVDQRGVLHLKLPDFPDGWYAVSCFHDLNNNGILDKNLLGIPTEPYGFSNGARPKFRAPNWEETRVWLNQGDTVELQLEQW